MDAAAAIAEAKKVLSLAPVDQGEDPRWQAIIEVGAFIHSDPEAVWQFILQAAKLADDDLQSALATCLLEHLIEQPAYMTRAKEFSVHDQRIADMLAMCWRHI